MTNIIEEFDKIFTEYGNGMLMNTKKAPLIKRFMIKKVEDIRTQTLQEVLGEIKKIKESVEKSYGTYKYSSCYEECEQIIKDKLK